MHQILEFKIKTIHLQINSYNSNNDKRIWCIFLFSAQNVSRKLSRRLITLFVFHVLENMVFVGNVEQKEILFHSKSIYIYYIFYLHVWVEKALVTCTVVCLPTGFSRLRTLKMFTQFFSTYKVQVNFDLKVSQIYRGFCFHVAGISDIG